MNRPVLLQLLSVNLDPSSLVLAATTNSSLQQPYRNPIEALDRNMDRHHQTGMDDVERRAVHGDPEIMEHKRKAMVDQCFFCLFATLLTLLLCMLVLANIYQLNAHYYVTVDSISPLGLDPATGGLSFNLTLGVSSSSYGAKACIQPGTHVEVSYRGFMLAASEAEAPPQTEEVG